MGEVGLEPTPLAGLEPKSSASASFATRPAERSVPLAYRSVASSRLRYPGCAVEIAGLLGESPAREGELSLSPSPEGPARSGARQGSSGDRANPAKFNVELTTRPFRGS